MNVKNRGYFVCWATNAMWPSYDDHARGRVHHLFATNQEKFDFPATLCGALAVKFLAVGEERYLKSICKQCAGVADKLEAKPKFVDGCETCNDEIDESSDAVTGAGDK